MMPTETEGFGLPAAEGAPLLASDLAILREVGGDAPVYRAVADLPAWSEAALSLLAEWQHAAARQVRREVGIRRTRRFAWSLHADQLAELYHEVLEQLP